MTPTIYYCYDAYCGWCYGFSPVLEKLFEEFREVMDFEVLSGNMIPKESAKHISATADYISKAYKQVEETMAKFHLEKGVKYDVKSSDSVIVITHSNKLKENK